MNKHQLEFCQRSAALETELAVRRLELEIMRTQIRAERNRELWYMAGYLAGAVLCFLTRTRRPRAGNDA